MIKTERKEIILSELAKRGTISVRELTTLLAVSSATVRRDISELFSSGSIARSHGGVSVSSNRDEPAYDDKLTAYLPEKRRIGALAASLIGPDLCIGCGGGTTVMQMVIAIKRHKLKLVTTAANVALELRDAENVEVVLTGGTMRRRTTEMIGHVAERTLHDINLDIAILGVDGINAQNGLTTFDFAEAYVNRVLISRAKSVWILADQSKLGKILPALICPLSSATRLITNTEASTGELEKLRHAGVEILRA